MFEDKEFIGALNAISECVTEDEFESIVEGAAALIEELGMSMDEATTTSAAALFTEELISESAFQVTDAVMTEYANRDVAWDEALGLIAESVDEDTFDQLMTEAVSDMVAKVKAKGEELKAKAAEKVPEIKKDAAEAGQVAKAAAQVAGKKVEKTAKGVAKDAKKAVADARSAVKRQVLKNKVEDKVEDLKDAAAEKAAAAKDAVQAAGAKVADAAKGVAAKVAPKNENALSLRELRAIVESVQVEE